MESGGGLFTSIQNMMAVAADKAYLNESALAFFGLGNLHRAHSVVTRIAPGIAYQVKIYCVWLFLRFTSAGRPIGIPAASLSYAFRRSGANRLVNYQNCMRLYKPYPWSLLPRPERFH